MQVRADGSCWVYVVLAGLNQLEHVTPLPWGKKQPCRDVTPKDQGKDLEVRTWIADVNPGVKHFADVLKVPDYARNRSIDKFLGSFGNAYHLQQLCRHFDVRVLLWDELDDDAEVPLITAKKFVFLEKNTASRVARESYVINVAFSKDRDNHFNVYVRN